MMPSGSGQYTLAGFSGELDWRPLRFVKPLPPNRVCSACGLVRPKTALLPCAHTMCESCYEQCVEDGLHICPLDGYECQDDDVVCRDFAADELFRREVKCWNDGNGCQCVVTVSRITQHFQFECGYHSVCCPKCSVTVPCSDVVAHLKSGFCKISPVASDGDGQSLHEKEVALLALLRGMLENQAGEVKEFLRRILDDVTAHGDRLSEISHGINSFKETVRKELSDGTNKSHESLAQVMSEIRTSNEEAKAFLISTDAPRFSRSVERLEKIVADEFSNAAFMAHDNFLQITAAVQGVKTEMNESSQEAMELTKSILRCVKLDMTLSVFFVNGVESLKKKATEEGWAFYDSEQVYLRGYYISPGVCFQKDDESLQLYASMQMHQGDMDDVVQWPFEHKIRLSVMHPKRGAERVLEARTLRSYEKYRRPTSSSNSSFCVDNASLNIQALTTDGYVDDDKLRIKWELLP